MMSSFSPLWRPARAAFRFLRDRRYRYQRLVEVLISRNSLVHNCQVFQQEYAPTEVAPVLKSNAYGHGLVLAARIFEAVRPPFFVVESYYEALVLRNEGIRTPIVVMGYTATENILRSRLPRVAYTLVDMSQLLTLSSALRRPQRFHLKVDTGMHRYGIPAGELSRALAAIDASPHMVLEGACSHMAKTLSSNDRLAQEQIATWNEVARVVRQSVPNISYLHLASTGGSHWSTSIDANVIRLGLGAYGYDLSPYRNLPLQPALSMESTIGALRSASAGDGIGYGHGFVAPRPMTVATIASGYDAGIDVRLSNRGMVTVRGIPCPIVGRVCMNATMIDVTDVPDVKVQDRATVISSNPAAPNAVHHIAQTINASYHVVLTGIPSHLKRIVT